MLATLDRQCPVQSAPLLFGQQRQCLGEVQFVLGASVSDLEEKKPLEMV
ncbi:hypothetical protein ABZ260_25260 [Streptosporangium sp. NPDC006013]